MGLTAPHILLNGDDLQRPATSARYTPVAPDMTSGLPFILQADDVKKVVDGRIKRLGQDQRKQR